MWLWLQIAAAGTLSATIDVGPDGASIRDAVPVSGDVRSAPGPITILGAGGEILATAAFPDPRLRSVVFPEGGGQAVLADRGVARVLLPWPEGAASVRLGASRTVPLAPVWVRPPPVAVPVLDNGASSERLDLVFLGDGYTAGQLTRFATDVDRVVDHLLSIEPYGAYSGLFNVWRIDVASVQSGASTPDASRDTAYGCFYSCFGIDRLLCCDDRAVMADVQAAVPRADGVMVLINDPTYGGSGGFNYGTSYNGDLMVEVASHELGHSLVGLWDEYSYEVPGNAAGAPNCSASESDVPWSAWTGDEGVDAFATCSYTNAWRPTNDGCMMRTLQDDYCAVCRQEAVLAIYDAIPDLILDTDPPAGSEVALAKGEAQAFTVETLGPDAGLRHEWRLDGRLIEEDDPAFVLDGCDNLEGELTLTVIDPTPWVRSDPSDRLRDSASWSVTTEKCGLFSGRGACGCDATPGLAGAWPLALLFLRRRRTAR